MVKIQNIFIFEWINECEQFIKDYRYQHEWDEDECLIVFYLQNI